MTDKQMIEEIRHDVYGVSITGYLLRLPTTAGSPRNSSHQKARVDE